MIPSIQDIIPAKARKAVYAILGFAWALELAFDLVPAGAQDRVAAFLALAGFTLAAGNTKA